MSQPTQIKKSALRQGMPITVLGLTLHPITMDSYEEFLLCKEALLARQASFPTRYLSLDYLAAIFAMENDLAAENGDCGSNMFVRLMMLLHSSLRIEFNGNEFFGKLNFDQNGGKLRLKSFFVTQGDTEVEITTLQFSQHIRPIIAELNGLELPDESQNIDIIKANEQKAALHAASMNLNADINDLIASVAYLSGISEAEINRWTVREFEARKRAIDRDKRYMLYSQAEMSGFVSFKNGNPAPSWCFDKLDDSLGTMSLSELGKRMGDSQQRTE